ncbi:MAG: peptidoglycan DD-metalloendopeptidase family protein [Anaerolineae bacterium]|nr:peptidoglycan DD-metalloendopeptidase family protein [Anaerolineae bacterium]
MPTPYDNLVALWHHWGRVIRSTTIDEFARDIKQRAPAIRGVFIKTHHGAQWMSQWGDTSPMGISGADSIDRWVNTLANYDMEFHAWCVPEGVDIAGEAQRMIDVATRPGVKSLILDVEPYAGFYQGPKESVRQLMVQVRANIAAGFHIGISIDPRPNHYNEIFPDEWYPFVGSAHPQVYWRTFQVSPDRALSDAYTTWRKFRRPIYPVLNVISSPTEMAQARSLAITQYGATGISWWLHSAVTDSLWSTLNVAIDGTVVNPPDPNPNPPPPGQVPTGYEIVVKPDDAAYKDGTYDGTPTDPLFKTFTNERGWKVKYKQSQPATSTVWARWDPQISRTGWYEISAFVPGQNATTDRARYKLHNASGQPGEQEISISQARFSDVWVPFGVYQLNADDPAAGVVFLNDLTGESDTSIAFDAIRWRLLGDASSNAVADGFDPPIGVASDRASARVWPGAWFDATGYAHRYRIGSPAEAYHTGADLNLNTPTWDTDAHSPVYAAASGVVTTVRRYTTWGMIIVIRHDPLASTGQVVYCRYAHVESVRVREGQRVRRGDQIASVGNADGTQPYHLHFDVSPTDVLKDRPDHWPKLNLANLRANYVDPRVFVASNRPVRR